MQPIRVLIVDDSALVRRVLSDVLASDPDIVVAGLANNGEMALQQIAALKPDIVTLDVEMPHMDGLATLIEIRKTDTKLPVIMYSTLTGPGAAATVEALARGASDYATKPTRTTSFEQAREAVKQEVLPKIRALCGRSGIYQPIPALPRPRRIPHNVTRVEVLAIGSSTGGPNALAELVPRLPAELPVPVVIVQHMPPTFTRLLAQRLNALSPLQVGEAEVGRKLEKGHVWIAPGDYHMTVMRNSGEKVLALNQDPPENSCRPAVDVLFRSLAKSCGSSVLAVVLTGMGCDGTRGASDIYQAGGNVIVQDEGSSVVWGMPGSIVSAGLADRVCPLSELPFEIVRRTSAGRGVAASS